MPNQPAQPDPALWGEPTMHRVLAARDVTALYQALVKLGFTQSQIAQLTGQSQSEVSEILAGRRVISYEVLVRISKGLGAPRGHMGLAYANAEGNVLPYPEEEGEGNPDPLEDDDVITRRVLGAASVALLGDAALDGPIMQLGTNLLGEPGGLPLLSGPSGKLDKHDVTWIRTATGRFREFQHEYGGGAIHAAVRGLAERVVATLLDSPPSRELYVVVSGLCRVAAWTAFEAGHRREFWQCHATALSLAKESGDTELIITTVQAAGRAHILTDNHRAAAKLFELTAVRRAPDAVGWGLLGSAYAPNSPGAARHSAVSSGECTTSLDQEFVEHFCGFPPAECLTWTIVELVGDGVELGLGVARQVGPFGEILAQQPVGRSYVCQAAACVRSGWGATAAWMRR